MIELFDAAIRLSEFNQIKEDMEEALNTDREECGHCDFWMKSTSCPREYNVNGRQKGPSCGAFVCNKFKLKDWVIKLKQERLKKVKERMFTFKATPTKKEE